MHENLIGRQYCFYIDGIQKCTIVFKLKIFNFHIQNFRYIKCSFVCLNFVLFHIIQIACFYCLFCFFRFIQFVLLCYKKSKGTFNSLQKKTKKINTRSSSRQHPRVLLCCAAPTFMLFHYSFFLKFVSNFEISCQGSEFAL